MRKQPTDKTDRTDRNIDKLMYSTRLSISILFFSLFGLATCFAADSLKTKDFQLVVQYHDRTVDTFEIREVQDYSTKVLLHNGYGIIIDENYETGPNILYTLDGQYTFRDKHGNEICFFFQINSSSGDKYSLIRCVIENCAEVKGQDDPDISGYYYFLKGDIEDIFQYKSPIMFVLVKNGDLRVELRIKS